MTPFDYVKSINKKDGKLEIDEGYVQFIINRSFSTYFDTVFYANEINKYPNLSNQMQYDFYYNAIPKNPKRFAPWPKKRNDKYLLIVQEYYDCSIQKAKEIISVLDDEKLTIIEMRLGKGGKDG
jgi:hypothetical protein